MKARRFRSTCSIVPFAWRSAPLFFALLPVVFLFALLVPQAGAVGLTRDLPADLASKIDPLLRIAYGTPGAEVALLGKTIEVERTAKGTMVDLLLLTDAPGISLASVGGTVRSVIGNVQVASVPLDRLADLAAIPGIRYVRASTYLHATNDSMSSDIGVPLARTTYGAIGAGAIVGIIDTGIDFSHSDFRNADGTTRIEYLWDQTDPTGPEPSEVPGGGGTEYAEADLNEDLLGGGFVPEVDLIGHGTHVAGTAAGGTLASGLYGGVASDASLLIVRASSDGSFPSARVLDALSYVDAKATALGLPYVVNMSFGGQRSAHDGSDPEEVALDNLIGSGIPGKAIAIAAGNDGAKKIHASGTLAPSSVASIDFHVTSGAFVGLTFWNSPTGGFGLNLRNPLGATTGVVSPGGVAIDTIDGNRVIVASTEESPLNGDGNVEIQLDAFLVPGVMTGTWTLSLDWTNGSPIEFDVWGYAGTLEFQSPYLDTTGCVTTPGNAVDVITVGSHVTKNSWVDQFGSPWTIPALELGEISSFSSRGPTRDGRVKPEITAPRERVASAFSSSTVYYTPTDLLGDHAHLMLQGTSMATPAVTGAIAALLGLDPTLDAAEIKTALAGSAREDGFTGSVPNGKWGYGKLDLLAASDEVSPPGPVIGFTPTPGSGSVSLSWTNPGNADFDHTVIRFSTSGYPLSPTGGEPVPNGANGVFPGAPGSPGSFHHGGLAGDLTYWYAAFACDADTNCSDAAYAYAPVSDDTPPAPVTELAAAPGDSTITLTWRNPSDLDFQGVYICYSTGDFPNDPTEGTPLPPSSGTPGHFPGAPGERDTTVAHHLANGLVHFFSAFAYDEVPNYSARATVYATPADTTPPGPVTSFTIACEDSTLQLAWTNPSDADFAGTVIRFSPIDYPSNSGDGSPVPNGNEGRFAGASGSSDNFSHKGLPNGTTYYYSAFAYDEALNHAARITAEGTPLDTIAPGPITAFTVAVGEAELDLSWTNPNDEDFAATVLRYSTIGYPSSPGDGAPVPNGEGGVFPGAPGSRGSFAHKGLVNGTSYYYAAFARDEVPNYSGGTKAEGVPGDLTPPGPVSSFTARKGDREVLLAWTNPPAPDFYATRIFFSTTGYPTGPETGTPVPNGNNGTFPGDPGAEGSFLHSGITNGTRYYYAAFASDLAGNIATGVQAEAIPADTLAPGPVTAFAAAPGHGAISLSWTNPSDADFAGTVVRFSTGETPNSPSAGAPVPNGNEGRFAGTPGSGGVFTHEGLPGGTTYYYAAFAYDEVPNYAAGAAAYAAPSDTAPPTLALGILQNPIFTANLDVYLVASEPLDSESVSMTIGAAPVDLRLNDADENVWRGDYTVVGSGVLALVASAEDLAGNEASVSGSFAYKRLSAAEGGSIASPDGVMEARVGAGALSGDTYLVLFGGDAWTTARDLDPSSPASYQVLPRGALRGREAEIVFHYRAAGVPAGEPDRLFVRHDESGEVLPSYVDPAAGTVSATITDFGRFSLRVGDRGSSVPADPTYALLEQNRPNPFNPTTTIRFEIRAAQRVRLDLFAISGAKVRTLVDADVSPGAHAAVWDGTDGSGAAAPSGVYFYRLRTAQGTSTKKMLLLR